MTSDKVLHVVVGAGNVPYFSNAIRSIKENNAGDVFAVYNFIDQHDRTAILQEEATLGELVTTLQIQENRPIGRTGSLYEANNMGLEFARGGYDFVSFVQADMQLMWWDQAIVARAREILDHCAPQGHSGVSFYTQLPVAGKREYVYEGWVWNTIINSYQSTGHVDVCLLPIYGGYNSDFKFLDDEKTLAFKRSSIGALLIFHPFPFVAPIPFPVTTRDGKRRPQKTVSKTTLPILQTKPNFHPDFLGDTLHPFTMEESVSPNGWRCLTPYWPSDTRDLRWIEARLKYCRYDLTALFSVTKLDGTARQFPVSGFKPGLKTLLHALFMMIARKLTDELKKIHPNR